MTPRRIGLYLAVAVPPLILAGVGVTHPTNLTAGSAEYWRDLHIAILPIFPLLGFAPWLLVRGRNRWLTIGVGVLAFVYAAFYTGLDVLAGIGAGGLKLDDMGMATGTVFTLGRNLGAIGAISFIAACLIAGIVAIRSAGPSAIPGAVLVLAGSALLYREHIYFPYGVLGQLCLAVGWVLIVLTRRERAEPQPS